MGVLEEMNAKLDAIIKSLAAGTHVNGAGAAAEPDPFAMPGTGPAAQPPAAVNATDEMIMALIQPHLSNATLKAALGAELTAMGINGLPNAQPAQYNEIFSRFQRVIGAAGTAPAGGSMSLV